MSKRIAFTIADENNMQYAKMMINSLRKFHTEEELPVAIVSGKGLQKRLSKDPHFFYRATPVVGKELLKDYDLVIKLDADQIIMGDLSYIWEQEGYDVGTVYNINRVDPQRYGNVTIQGVPAQKYYNCGLVAMRSKEFVNHWHDLCFSEMFYNLQYREQDLLNILAHYGRYNINCFDQYDPVHRYFAWHGLLAKGEGLRMKLKDGEVILPRGEDNYPDRDVVIKVYHFAGGKDENKYNYRTQFNEEIISHIDHLISNGKEEKGK